MMQRENGMRKEAVEMLLVFEIGNTEIKMGVFRDDDLVAYWRMITGSRKTSDEYGITMLTMLQQKNITPGDIDSIVVSSVVPHIMHSFLNAVRRYIGKEPFQVAPGIKTGICIRCDNPKEVGADLIADVSAAYTLYGGPCLVVDFGTATKYEVITEDGAFVAAVIAPGLGISAEAMCKSAAQLPAIEIKKPKKILTANTIECMQAGLVYGYIGSVEYIITKIKEEMNQEMKVVATGGLGRVIVEETDVIDVYDPMLTLKGLRVIADKNKLKRQ